MEDHNENVFDSEEEEMKIEEDSSSSSSNSNGEVINNNNNEKKSCAICGTSKTPLWRSGPAGPKSLCNACGIRNRKKKRTVISPRSEDNNINKKKNRSSSKFGDSLKQRLIELGREVMMQRSRDENQRRKKLGEDEQAAVLLMALSYTSSVYA